MQTRRAGIIDAHIGIKRAAKRNLVTLQRNRHRQQFAAEENQCGPSFTGTFIPTGKRVDFVWFFT